MNCFIETYYQTTHPKTEYKELLSLNVGKSILTHVVVYIGFLYILQFVSNIKVVETKHIFSLVLFLIIVMVFGFLGRLMRSKTIYEEELKEHDEDEALKQTKHKMDNAYFTWYFVS